MKKRMLLLLTAVLLFLGTGMPQRAAYAGSPAEETSQPGAGAVGLIAYCPEGLVPVVQLGAVESIVAVNGAPRTVPTAGLIFAGNIPAERAVAVIHAPESGCCDLLQLPAADARPLAVCRAGTLVAVLGWGDDYCRILYAGEAGYLPTGSLRFTPTDAVPVAAVLTCPDRACTSVAVLCDARSDAPEIARWPVQTEVSVFARVGEWLLVEHDGLQGFVHEDSIILKH